MARPTVFARRSLLDLDDPPVAPMEWSFRSLAAMGEEAFATALLRASEGDPFETSTPASALADLREMRAFAETAFDATTWVIVSDDEGEVGVLLPQPYPDEPDRGTLFYVGVFPERRGRGLGTMLHRHGLGLLRGRGVTRYLGSTDVDNAPMLAVFLRNGCTLDRSRT